MSKLLCWHCVAEVQLFKWCRNLSARHCVAEVQLFKQCCNLSAGTVLQGCSCLVGVETYLPTLCCRGAAVLAVSKPICRHCVAGVQLFKQCRNLYAGTVLQGCSCLNSVPTYLPALCCRGSAILAVSSPICWHCVAGVQLFKWCRNLPGGTVLQGCSCLSSVLTYLLALCCRGAPVKVVLEPTCRALCCRGVAV